MHSLILSDVVALVSGRDGYFLVNRKDAFIGRSLEIYGEFCGLEATFLQRLVRPGDYVVEVGANIGSHTVGLAKAVGPGGKVFAFEPQRACFSLLQAQIALNQLGNVLAYSDAVGQSRGRLWVPAVNYSEIGNFGGVALSREHTPASEAVDVVTLDERLGEMPCALIKIDVEGMEEDVIRGAADLIEKQHPLLYVENDRVEKSKGLVSLLLQLGYRLWWHLPPLYNPNNSFGVQQNVFGNIASFNMFCAREQHPATEGLAEIKSADEPHPLAPRPMQVGWRYSLE